MRAAVCYDFGKPLVVEDVEQDPPQLGEVMVRLAACAICHSDVHQIRGDWGGNLPIVCGHEAAGVISAVGPGVTSVQPGDHVVVSLLRQCGQCFQCTIGRPYNCEKSWPLQTESRLRNQAGVPLAHGIRTAAFAESTIVDQSQVVKIPDDLSLECAALLACGVITGVGAVVNTAQVKAGSKVVVIGTGGVGINVVQGALLVGASMIIAVDLLDNKLQAARMFGATHTIHAAREDVLTTVMELTGGRGADYAFVAVGAPKAIEQSVMLVRLGGLAVIVGIPSSSEATVSFNSSLFTPGRTLTGSPMGSTRLQIDIPWLIDLYRHGRLKLDELISGRYSLDQINEAIESMERGEALRNVITLG